MPTPSYRVLYSPVLAPHDIAGELPVEAFSWDLLLNAPGSATFMVPLERTTSAPFLTGQVDPDAIPADDIGPARTALFVERNGDLVWGGVLWTRRYDFTEGTVELNAEGWWSYVRRRHLRVDRTYTGVDQALIAQDLVDLVATGFTSGADIGIDTSGGVATGVTRDRAYNAFERKNLAEAVEQLGAVEDGFDWRIDTLWGPGGAPLLQFVVDYPAGGRTTEYTFELGANVAMLDVDEDASDMANFLHALGSGEGDDRLIWMHAEGTSRGDYPWLEATPSWPDVVDISTLAGHAAEELMRRRRPLLSARATLHSGAEPGIGAVRVGDIVRVIGGRHVDGDFRIVGLAAQVDENGDEEVSLDLATAVLFTP
jgi:hypothetical protein